MGSDREVNAEMSRSHAVKQIVATDVTRCRTTYAFHEPHHLCWLQMPGGRVRLAAKTIAEQLIHQRFELFDPLLTFGNARNTPSNIA